MQKKIMSLYFTISFFCLILGGCINTSPSDGNHILYVDTNHHHSIQDAVQAAGSNDTIIVSAGRYYERISIEKPITLIAKEPTNTFILVNQEQQDYQDFIQIKAQNCTIEGFTIQGNYPYSNASGIAIFTSNNIIRNNNFFNVYYGIYVYSGSDDNMLSYNTIKDSEHGLYICSFNNKVWNNTVMNNTFGIYLRDCYFNNIFSNYIYGNTWGIRLKGATTNQLFENQIQNNQEGVYACCGAMQNTIFNNNFINNRQNAYDDFSSNWYKNTTGNYWSDYYILYPSARVLDTIWDTPYLIPGGESQDKYPLVKPFSS